MRKILTSFAIAIAVAVAITETVSHLGAASSTIVISQVYGGGGNSGAPFKNDFIELFNRGTSAVSLNGWSVQYAATGGTSWQVTPLSNVTLQPGQYYLVQEAAGAGTQPLLPAPDATGTIGMASGAGKVALLTVVTTISSGTACPSANVVDLVGYGTGTNCFEGSGPTTPALTNTTAALRNNNGCTETDSNSGDFTAGAPNPRNTVSPMAPCGGGDAAPSVSSTTPSGGATDVAFKSSIVITFSESVTASPSAFSLECPAGSPQAFTQSASPATAFTLTPNVPLPAGVTCAVKATASQVTDTDTIDPPDAMASDFSFAFSTVNPVDAAPSIVSVTPANGASNVAVSSPIVVNFSESVTASPSAFSIQCPAGVAQGFGQSASPAATITLTPSLPLPYGTSCAVTVTANQISDTDPNDPPDGMASDVAFSFTTAAAPPPGAGKVMINEIDADTPGSDTAEFIELYDGGTGNTPLDGLVVVLYDGGAASPYAGNQVYAAFDLAGKSTDASGYFVLGNPGVANAGLTFDPGQFGLLQNGPDAVALYIGHASDFPNGRIVTAANVLDAVVYGTDDPAPANLMSLINSGQKIANENAAGTGTTQSSQRCPNGMGGFRNTSPYSPGDPTPGTANNCPARRPPSDVVMSQIYGGGGNSGATYLNDFVELYNRGTGPVDLTGWSLQYSPAASSGSSFLVQPIGGSIGAGEYYLIQLASGGAVGSPLPVDANIVGNINISATSGKVALVNSFDALLGGCPIYDPHIMDIVGYGTADSARD